MKDLCIAYIGYNSANYLVYTGWNEDNVPMTNCSYTYAYSIMQQFHA